MYRRRYYQRTRRPAQQIVRFVNLALSTAGTMVQTDLLAGYNFGAGTLKNIYLEIGSADLVADEYLRYAVMIDRANTEPTSNPVNTSAAATVEPARDVLIAGVLTSFSEQDRKRSPIMCKLQQGDTVRLYLNGSISATAHLVFRATFLE